MRAFLLLFAGSIGCLVQGMNLRADDPFGLQPPVPSQPIPAVPMNPVVPPNPVPPPQFTGELPPSGFNEPTAAERLEQQRKAEAALDKPGPKMTAPGDDELKKLLIAKYNAAFAEVKTVEAAYGTGTIPFESIFDAQKRLLQAELDLSDKPADQIAAFEKQLEMAKHVEQRIKSLALSYSKGGEADKYYQAKYMRLDAEIQLLRAKRKAGLAK